MLKNYRTARVVLDLRAIYSKFRKEHTSEGLPTRFGKNISSKQEKNLGMCTLYIKFSASQRSEKNFFLVTTGLLCNWDGFFLPEEGSSKFPVNFLHKRKHFAHH
jgi:hypothetical protein